MHMQPPAPSCPPDDELWQALPSAGDLQDGGAGIRFEVLSPAPYNAAQTASLPAFAVKHHGHVHAYLNQCAHVAMEMDWQAGQFFDFDAQYLMCATHGAQYEPATGLCIAGPCIGKSLKPVSIVFYDNTLYARRTL
jgi:nitrite reductase/ring-hydroxylating ferredoxin subunit